MLDPAFFTLQKNKINRIITIFTQRQWAKMLVIIFTLLIFFLLAVGVLVFSYLSFRFIGEYPQFNQPVVLYTLAVTFILTSVLIFLSATITGLGTLFLKEDNGLLFSSPVKTATIFESRLLDMIVLNSWPVFVFALPLILGYGLALKLSAITTLLFLTGLLLLTLSATLLGALLVLVVSWIVGGLKSKVLFVILALTVPLAGLGLINLILPPKLLTDLGALSISQIARLVNRQALLAEFLPTTWLVNLIYFWTKKPILSLQSGLYLAVFLTAIALVLLILRGRFYLKAVSKSSEGHFVAAPWDAVSKKARSFPYLLKGRLGALTEKDWLLILRSPPQIFQLGFIFFLQLIYYLVVARVPMVRLARLFPGWHQESLARLNYLFIGYLVSVLAMRYFFPMISLEGHSSWLIWTAPIKRIKIFWQKLISSLIILLVWLEISTLISIQIAGLTFYRQWPLLLVNLPLAITITFISLGIGAIKPNFWEKNPEKLSTSPAGILATGLCLSYIALVTLLLTSQKFGFSPLAIHLAIWFLSALIVLPILIQVYRQTPRYEI